MNKRQTISFMDQADFIETGEYFQSIKESLLVGQREQAKEQFKNLGKFYGKAFLKWFIHEGSAPKDIIYFLDLL